MSETVALYIDADNISHTYLHQILSTIANSNVIIKKIYGDWSKQNMLQWLNKSNDNGITAIQCGRLNKNSSDIKMSVDIMKDLYTNNNITLFYLVTSDSDFSSVIGEIKNMNKKAYCTGYTTTSKMLINSCDKFILLISKETIAKENRERIIKENRERRIAKENIERIAKENRERIAKENIDQEVLEQMEYHEKLKIESKSWYQKIFNLSPLYHIQG
jgi:hypothetical protein